ncbi:hypothetical protein DESC_770175 [Desulfosarcina cetonica]|nr:hypothetical protein DESC_770175 [Desulfosarcina cetonica]
MVTRNPTEKLSINQYAHITIMNYGDFYQRPISVSSIFSKLKSAQTLYPKGPVPKHEKPDHYIEEILATRRANMVVLL